VKQLIFLLISLFIIGTLSGQEVVLKNGKYQTSGGSLYSGVFKEYDAQGILVAENKIKNGLLDSISNIFYNSGSKKEQRSYKEGKKEGLWINWALNGTKTAEARFLDGYKDGYWYIWDEKGTKRYEMFYIKGEKKGRWLIWDENGKLVTEQNYK
jgi:antitoxin component YwqK of YwqJK toxin-antitoxin module